MKKNYTAVYIPAPHSTKTKGGFSSIKDAETYINKTLPYSRANWLIINTKTLQKHLEILEKKTYEYQE